MAGDESGLDTVRLPGDDNSESGRLGVRAVAKKVAKKVASKVAKKPRKKSTKKATAAARKATKNVAKTATRPARAATSAAIATGSVAAAPDGAPAKRAATASEPPSGKEAAAAPAARAVPRSAAHSTRRGASPHAAESTPSAAPALAIEAPRPPAPMHPGASLDSVQEQVGGFGGLLALWGPLIIVGFLVLIFRGGDERPGEQAGSPGSAMQAAGTQPLQWGSARTPAPVSGYPDVTARLPGAVQGVPEGYDRSARAGGLTMRTSMAAAPAFTDRGSGSAVPPDASLGAYPPPPGPYINPWGRSVSAGEQWTAAGTGEQRWPDAGRSGPQFRGAGDPQTRWVQCAPPYYWCPAPAGPAW